MVFALKCVPRGMPLSPKPPHTLPGATGQRLDSILQRGQLGIAGFWRILMLLRPLKARAMTAELRQEVSARGLMVEYLTYYVRLGALRRKRHKGMSDGAAMTVQR
jgi:hypothetical protein